MPKKSAIDIKSISKDLVKKSQEIVDTVPAASFEAPKEEPVKVVQQQGRGAGRPKGSTISRNHAKTIYFEDEMFQTLTDVKFNNRVNMQRVVQTAVELFLKRYCENGTLNEKGMEHIANYEKKVSI